MSNLQQLDEALGFLNDGNKPKIIEEGFFSRLKSLFNKGGKHKEKLPEYTYYISSVEKSIGLSFKFPYPSTTMQDAIATYIIGVLEAGCYDFGNIKILKKNQDKLTEEFYIYKCKIINKLDKYEYSGKIENLIYSGSVSGALSKFNIKYEIIDTSNIEKERKAIRAKAIKIATDVINDAKKLHDWDGCYKVYKDSDLDEENIEFWNTGLDNSIEIIDYDLDNYKGNKREYFGTTECSNVFNFVWENFKKRIESEIPDVHIDYPGDWDAGSIDIFIQNK